MSSYFILGSNTTRHLTCPVSREVKINPFTGTGTGSIILFGSFTDISKCFCGRLHSLSQEH